MLPQDKCILEADFIKFLRENKAIQFGEFKLKYGRVSPILVDVKDLNDGEQLLTLGRFYAKAIINRFGYGIDAICGIAYKGTPLVVATVAAIYELYGFCMKFCVYGGVDYDGTSVFRGATLEPGSKIVIIDDVIVSGATIETAVKAIREQAVEPKILGMMIAVDRQEIGTDKTITAVQEVSRRNMIPVEGIVTKDKVLDYLRENADEDLDDSMEKAIEEYYQMYSPAEMDEHCWNPA